MNRLYEIREYLEKAEKFIIIIFLALMVLFVFLQTIIRALAGILPFDILTNAASSFDWSLKAAYFLFIWVIFLSASITTSSRKHISIDILTKLVSKKVKTYLTLIVNTISFFSSILLFIISMKWLFQNDYFILAAIFRFINRFGAGINIQSFYDPVKILGVVLPAWTVDAALPIGFMLIAFKFFINLLDDIQAIRGKNYEYLDKFEKETFA